MNLDSINEGYARLEDLMQRLERAKDQKIVVDTVEKIQDEFMDLRRDIENAMNRFEDRIFHLKQTNKEG